MVRTERDVEEVYKSSDLRASSEYIVADPYVVEYMADVSMRRGRSGDGIRVLKHDPVTDGFEEVAREAGPNYYERFFEPLRENHSEAGIATFLRQFEQGGRVYVRAAYEEKFGRQDIDQEKLQEIISKLGELKDL